MDLKNMKKFHDFFKLYENKVILEFEENKGQHGKFLKI